MITSNKALTKVIQSPLFIRKLGTIEGKQLIHKPLFAYNPLRIRRYSEENVFRVQQKIKWNKLSDQGNTMNGIQSSGTSKNRTASENDDPTELFKNDGAKTLMQVLYEDEQRIIKLEQLLQNLPERLRDENWLSLWWERLSLKREIRKIQRKKLAKATQYSSEMLSSLGRSAAQIYFDCANRYPYLKLCESFGLPDYFSTWYKLTLMHCWMVLVRLQSSLEAGAYIRIRDGIISMLFEDIEKRLKVIADELEEMVQRKKDKRSMTGLYLQTFFEYDEGFVTDDTTLAGALWRNLYMQRSVDPIHLNRAVYYIRGTMAYLNTLSLEEILLDGVKEWKTARPAGSRQSAYEDAKTVASSLLKTKQTTKQK